MEPTDYTHAYDPDTDFDAVYTRATGDAIARWVRPGDRLLELGCATGLMTATFAAAGARVTAVDRAPHYLDRLRDRGLPHVTPVLCDLAGAWPEATGFDHVVATSLLHQIDDPAAFLRAAAARLAPAGQLHVSVPNPRSLHRLVAYEMGTLPSLDRLSALNETNQVLRVLDRGGIEDVAAEAGLQVAHHEGVVLKPLPNNAMAALPADVLEGFVRAAKHVPALCAMDLYLLRAA